MSAKFFLFKEYYKMIVTDSSKEQKQDIDLKSIKQIDHIENSEQSGNKTVLFILVKVKETFLDILKGIWEFCKHILL